MKFIALMMAALVLALCLLPCGESSSAGHETAACRNDAPQEEGHGKDCSPFCVCTCCPGLAFAPRLMANVHTGPALSGLSEADVRMPLKEIPFSFWQPPRG